METFFDRLDKLLRHRKESYSDLARVLGTRQSTVSTWKKRNNIPSADIVLEIARHFNTSIEYLLTGVNQNPFKSTSASDLTERVRSLIKNGDDLKALSLRLDVDSEDFYFWLIAGHMPSYDVVAKIADFFKVSAQWLVTGVEPDPQAYMQDSETYEHMEGYRKLSPLQKKAVDALQNSFLLQNKEDDG